MHSTKSIGLVIIFLVSTFLFHFLFQMKAASSGLAVWIASAAFGIIASYLLHMTTQHHEKG
jgi:hypothetical protein